MARFDKRTALLAEVQPVLLVTAVRPASGPCASEFRHEISARRQVVRGVGRVDIVQPELALVVPDRLFCLVAIGDVNVRKSVVVEIECAASPGPTRACDGIGEPGSFEPPIGTGEVETIAESHARTHRCPFRSEEHTSELQSPYDL